MVLPDVASGIEFTSTELRRYRDDPNSGVRRLTDQLHIGLPPAGLADFKAAVIECLRREKLGRYDARLDGIVLDVRNIKVLTQGGGFVIHTDHPELHLDLLADLHVFRPTIGAEIRGVIKHIAKGHISVTIHRVFNVAIRLAGGVRPGCGLAVNAEIGIKVTDFDLNNTIPYIAGELSGPARPLASAMKKTTTATVLAKAEPVAEATKAEVEADPSSDEDDDNRSVLVDSRVNIKKEPHSGGSDHSDSSDESANESDHQASGNSDDDDDDEEEAIVPQPKLIANIKQEKPSALAAEQSASASESDSGAEVTKRPAPIVKGEQVTPSKEVKRSNTSSDSEDVEQDAGERLIVPAIVKREKSSPAKRKSSSSAVIGSSSPTKKSRSSAAAVDTLLQQVLVKSLATAGETTPLKSSTSASAAGKKRSKAAAILDDSLADITSFASPGLSSTRLPQPHRSKKSKS